MAKKSKDEKNQKQEQAPLTEWQKRNLDFLKQREKKKQEQEKLKKELADKNRARFKGKSSSSKEDSESDRDDGKGKKPKTKAGLKKKSKPAKKAPVKPLPKKPKPKSTKFKRRLTSVLVPAFLGILLALYMMTPLSKIKQVTVEGVSQTDSQSVLQASGLKDSDYTLATIFNRSQLAHSVAKNDVWVKSATVDYQFPFTFSIKVKEYSIVAYAQTDQGYVPILESGTRLNSVEATDLPDAFTTINLENGKYLSSLIRKLTKMDKSLISEIKVITLADSKTTPDLLNLEMQDGNKVRVPLSQIDKKLPYYDKIKDSLKDNHIIDMEVGIFATNDNEGEAEDTGDSDDSTPDQAPEESQADDSGEQNPDQNTAESSSEPDNSDQANNDQAANPQ